MVSGKSPIYQWKRLLDLSFLFVIKNVASGCTLDHLGHLESCFFLLYVLFKFVTRKSVVFPIKWNIEKNTTLNTLIYLFKINNKSRTKFCKTWPNLTRKAPDQRCGTEFLQMCSFSILSTLWSYHFHCTMSFLPLYLSVHLDSLHHHPDSPQFSHFHPDSPDFQADSP